MSYLDHDGLAENRSQPEHACEPAPGSVFDSNNLWWTTAELADTSRHPRWPLRAECRDGHRITRAGRDEDWHPADLLWSGNVPIEISTVQASEGPDWEWPKEDTP